MKKKITITIECETGATDEYIQTALRRGTYRALDTSPYYVSAPKEVESIDIKIEDIEEVEEEPIEERKMGYWESRERVEELRRMDGHDDIIGNPSY